MSLIFRACPQWMKLPGAFPLRRRDRLHAPARIVLFSTPATQELEKGKPGASRGRKVTGLAAQTKRRRDCQVYRMRGPLPVTRHAGSALL
jgi:hypothetical protein